MMELLFIILYLGMGLGTSAWSFHDAKFKHQEQNLFLDFCIGMFWPIFIVAKIMFFILRMVG
jgi:hypothetical protein